MLNCYSMITQHVPAVLPQYISYLGSNITGDGVAATSSLMESAFYATLQAGAAQVNRVIKWARETTISRIREIQALFTIANALTCVYYTKRIADEVRKYLPLSGFEIAANMATSWMVGALPVALVATGVYAVGYYVINHYGNKVAPQHAHGMTISQTPSKREKIARAIGVTKTILNLALACLSKNKLSLAISLVSSSYSIFKQMRIKWLQFNREIPIHNPNIPELQGAKVSYNMLALAPRGSSQRENCSICLAGEDVDEPQTDLAFCKNHELHTSCVSELIAQKTANVFDGARIRKLITQHFRNGVYNGSSSQYVVNIPEKNVPNCPVCREYPQQNSYDIVMDDALIGNRPAKVTIIRPPTDTQPLFESIYGTYNIAQGALAFLEQYPEYAATIYKIQQVMGFTDILGLLGTGYFLHKKIKEKLNISQANQKRYTLAFMVSFVAVGALAYFAVKKINEYLRPAIDLKGLLAERATDPSIAITWTNPHLLQSLTLARTIMSLALAFFTKKPLLAIASTLSQIFSFTALSRLKLIEYTQNLSDYPLKAIFATGATHTDNLDSESLASLKVQTEYLVDPSCLENAHHLKATLKGIDEHAKNLLNKSSWDCYLEITYYNGIESSRKLTYEVGLQPTLPSPCECTLTPSVTDIKLTGIDSDFGKAAFDVF